MEDLLIFRIILVVAEVLVALVVLLQLVAHLEMVGQELQVQSMAHQLVEQEVV